MKINQLLLTLIFVFAFSFAKSQETTVPKRTYVTKPTKTPPVIDGILDDDSWNVVEWESDFVQRLPNDNAAPTYQTKFKITYDSKFLYVAIRALDDEPHKIEKRLSRRDGFNGDWVEINIDSYNDDRTGFSFTFTAAGVKADEFISKNGKEWDKSWNPTWYAATSTDEKGWSAEYKIPFSQLKFGKSKEQIWGLQIQRRFFRKEERSVWQRVPVDAPGWVSGFGILKGLIDIQPQKQLEIQPYFATQYDSYPKETGNPFRDGSDFKLDGGLDAKIGITNDLTLDLTVNPDFGQVEADPAAIALDGFQIFFEEQRPFFVENKNIFDFQFADGEDNLFYSRRIGRSPQGSVSLANGEYAKTPLNTTILGAAKFSGKTKNGWSIGVLESVTANEYAKIDDNGSRRKEVVEPFSNYFVARAQKDFNDRNTFVGGIFTATNRSLKGNLTNLHKEAYSGGIDFRHNWKDRKYFLRGNIIASHVVGSPEAIEATQKSITHLFQREDASHVKVNPTRTSLTGSGGLFETGKAGGGNWRYNLGVIWRSPELELNDIGFLRQADEIRQFAKVSYLWQKPTKIYREAKSEFSQLTTYDFEGNHNRTNYELTGEVTWINNWETKVILAYKPRIFINTFLRGGPRWRYSDESFHVFSLRTDRRKKLLLTLDYVGNKVQEDNFSFNRYSVEMNYQLLNALNLSLGVEFETNPNKTQYVTQQSFGNTTRYILGNIDQKTWRTTLRLNYSINPNLSIQYYGQPFISRGRYTDFNYVNNATAENLYDRVTLYNNNQISYDGSNYLIDENLDANTDYSFGNPDFSSVQFRSNLVMRWEYIPGSEIFFVWSQGVTGLDDPRNSLRDALKNQILDQKKENTFLIKMTYRFLK